MLVRSRAVHIFMYVIQPNVFVVFILLNLFKIIYNNLIKFSKQFNNLYVI